MHQVRREQAAGRLQHEPPQPRRPELLVPRLPRPVRSRLAPAAARGAGLGRYHFASTPRAAENGSRVGLDTKSGAARVNAGPVAPGLVEPVPTHGEDYSP